MGVAAGVNVAPGCNVQLRALCRRPSVRAGAEPVPVPVVSEAGVIGRRGEGVEGRSSTLLDATG